MHWGVDGDEPIGTFFPPGVMYNHFMPAEEMFARWVGIVERGLISGRYWVMEREG